MTHFWVGGFTVATSLISAFHDGVHLTLSTLLVGHTHDAIDRFFSRLRVAIVGRDYHRVAALMKLIVDGLPGFRVRHSRVGSSEEF